MENQKQPQSTKDLTDINGDYQTPRLLLQTMTGKIRIVEDDIDIKIHSAAALMALHDAVRDVVAAHGWIMATASPEFHSMQRAWKQCFYFED